MGPVTRSSIFMPLPFTKKYFPSPRHTFNSELFNIKIWLVPSKIQPSTIFIMCPLPYHMNGVFLSCWSSKGIQYICMSHYYNDTWDLSKVNFILEMFLWMYVDHILKLAQKFLSWIMFLKSLNPARLPACHLFCVLKIREAMFVVETYLL